MSERWIGSETAFKQKCFSVLIETHLRICKNIFARGNSWVNPTYHYFDLNAGSGRSVDGYGSPLIMAETAYRKVEVPFQSWLFEKEPAEIAQLYPNVIKFQQTTPRTDYIINIMRGDHMETFPTTLKPFYAAKEKRYGLVYADPPGSVPPFDLLEQINTIPCFSTMDVLIYLSASNLKRFRCCNACKFNSLLSDALKSVGKKNIIVRQPKGKHQWTFALLTNWDAHPQFKKQGFYNIASPEGQEIITKLNHTKEELENRWTGVLAL